MDFYVTSAELLGSNFKVTTIDCDKYDGKIDNNITVTVSLKDVYDDPIAGESVTVAATAGEFIELNEESITPDSSVTGVTDAMGQFTLTYQCSSWGLITFTANNKTVQCNVTGFKKIIENTTYTLRVDESTRCCQIEAHRTGVTITNGHSFSNYNDFVIPSKYYPKSNCFSLIMRNTTFLFWLFNNGTYGVTNLGDTVQGYNLGFIHEWHY